MSTTDEFRAEMAAQIPRGSSNALRIWKSTPGSCFAPLVDMKRGNAETVFEMRAATLQRLLCATIYRDSNSNFHNTRSTNLTVSTQRNPAILLRVHL
jgi:hypothetical protein